MRAFLAAAGTSLAFGLSPGASGQTHATPKLRVAGQMVIGVNFHARERVRIRFISDATHTRVVRTNAKGMFSAPLSPYESCRHALTIKAVGARGDAARVFVPKTDCLPK